MRLDFYSGREHRPTRTSVILWMKITEYEIILILVNCLFFTNKTNVDVEECHWLHPLILLFFDYVNYFCIIIGNDGIHVCLVSLILIIFCKIDTYDTLVITDVVRDTDLRYNTNQISRLYEWTYMKLHGSKNIDDSHRFTLIFVNMLPQIFFKMTDVSRGKSVFFVQIRFRKLRIDFIEKTNITSIKSSHVKKKN